MAEEAGTTDPAETFIGLVQTLLDRNYGKAVGRGLKASETYEEKDFPCVSWRYDDGRHEPGSKTGGVTGAFYTDVQPLIARIWGASRGDCRVLKQNLILACREVAAGANFRPTRYKWVTEGGAIEERGAALDFWIELLMPVLSEPTAFPTPLFQVLSQTQATSVADPATGHSTQA